MKQCLPVVAEKASSGMCVQRASDAGERVDDDGECVWVVAGGSGSVVGRDNWEQERAAGLGWLQVQVWVLAWNRVRWSG